MAMSPRCNCTALLIIFASAMRGEACEVQRSAKRAKRAKRCNGVVQRLEQWSPKPKVWVQFPSPL